MALLTLLLKLMSLPLLLYGTPQQLRRNRMNDMDSYNKMTQLKQDFDKVCCYISYTAYTDCVYKGIYTQHCANSLCTYGCSTVIINRVHRCSVGAHAAVYNSVSAVKLRLLQTDVFSDVSLNLFSCKHYLPLTTLITDQVLAILEMTRTREKYKQAQLHIQTEIFEQASHSCFPSLFLQRTVLPCTKNCRSYT
jgi:hypothetical protein